MEYCTRVKRGFNDHFLEDIDYRVCQVSPPDACSLMQKNNGPKKNKGLRGKKKG